MSEAPYELSVSRYIDASPDKVWKVMTTRIEEWWSPKPWRAEVVEQQWRAGGRSCITMHGREGEHVVGEGIFLEVTPGALRVHRRPRSQLDAPGTLYGGHDGNRGRRRGHPLPGFRPSLDRGSLPAAQSHGFRGGLGSHCTHTEVYGEGFDPVSPESVIEIWVPVDPP